MSTDTKELKELQEIQIQKHASIDLCKECYSCHIVANKVYCVHPDPSPINCNVLKVHGDF